MKRLSLMAFFAGVFLAWEPASLLAQPIRVVATVPDLADIARQIGGDRVRAESLAQGSENMHAVPVKPSFVPRLNRADVLIVMGLDLEAAWLPALLEVASNPRILPGNPGYIDASAHVTPIEVPARLDRAEGDVHPRGNPHIHLDPVNGKLIAQAIAEGLGRAFPQHRPTFQKNLQAYLAELDRWISRWTEIAAPLRGVKVVTYHLEWSYFARRFGLQQIGTIELRPGIEPTPGHLLNLVQRMRDEKVQLVLYGAQSDRIPKQLASQTGAKAVRLQTIGGGRPETDNYIKFIDYNVRALLEALRS